VRKVTKWLSRVLFRRAAMSGASIIALMCLLPTGAAALESCLSADIALENWREVDATSAADAGTTARCWQSE
jgi:hypothetical protein